MFNVVAHFTKSFVCSYAGTMYNVMIDRHEDGTVTFEHWTYLEEAEAWSFHAPVPEVVLSHIALELKCVYDIVVDGYEFFTPSYEARRRAFTAAMRTFDEVFAPLTKNNSH